MSDRDAQKRAAAEAAAAEVSAGHLVGLGTGSTAAFVVTALARRLPGLACVATSLATARAATAMGLRVLDFADRATVDIAIDGVDEIDPALRAIKGAGGALLREKIVATAATRMIAVADAGKRVARLGRGPVPVEVLPFAAGFVAARLAAIGGLPTMRGPARTDQGNALIDCAFGAIADPAALAARLSAIPGLLAHGLFLGEIDALYVADDGGVARFDRSSTPADG